MREFLFCLFLFGCGTTTVVDGGTDATNDTTTMQKQTCSPTCGPNDVCKEPGACMFDAVCIPRSSVTCPEAGLCTAPGCAGELDGGVLRCTCR